MFALATVATLAFGLSAAQVADAPFQLDLPAGYAEFQRLQPDVETWASVHQAGDATFEVHHYLLAAPGAVSELVADNLRKTRWKPMLAKTKHTMTAWKGEWAGQDGAGTSIEYLHTEEDYRYLEQRLVVLDDHLIIANWDGPLHEKQAAEKALLTFVLPEAWKPKPPPEVDVDRGARAADLEEGILGHFHIRIDASDPAMENVDFEINWRPADGVRPLGPNWHLPEGALLQEATETKVRYRIPMFDPKRSTPPGGLIAVTSGLGGFGGTWMAMPASYAPKMNRLAPQPHTLEVLSPAFLEALSGTSATKSELDDETSSRFTAFQPNVAPKAWPYFVLGMYEYDKVADHAIAIRRTSKASRYEKTLTMFARLQRGLSEWLPNAANHWSVTTFRGSGDLIMPGMFILDENNQWLSEPVDGQWIDGNRRAGLARKLSSHVFGVQLTGKGHGSVFLTASLSEYAAWRILQSTGLATEAEAMVEFWLQNENTLGALPRPLTLMPLADLQGAKRLMTRGGLVWLAIEKRATRAKLDQTLNQLLKSRSHWTTEELRKALEENTEQDWLAFFQDHVYGKKLP